MSRCQINILRWLAAYPGINLQCEPHDDARPGWTHRWASEECRQEMQTVMKDLSLFTGRDGRADVTPAEWLIGGTPQCNSNTFRALVRRCLIHVTATRKRGDDWSAMNYWQISQRGRAYILGNP